MELERVPQVGWNAWNYMWEWGKERVPDSLARFLNEEMVHSSRVLSICCAAEQQIDDVMRVPLTQAQYYKIISDVFDWDENNVLQLNRHLERQAYENHWQSSICECIFV